MAASSGLDDQMAVSGDAESLEEIRLYSVTNLNKLALGAGEGLMTWIANTCSDFAVNNHDAIGALLASGEKEAARNLIRDSRWRKTDQAAERGTLVHAVAEAMALGVEPKLYDHLQPWVDQWELFLADFKPKFLMAEAPVYNVKHRYAGTLDIIAELDGLDYPVMIDVKTTEKKPEENRPPYEETSLQIVAYARAEMVGVSPMAQRTYGGRRYYIFNSDTKTVPMPKVGAAFVLVISPYDYQLVPCRIENDVWHVFLNVIDIARWRTDLAKRTFGPAITPPKKEEAA